MRFGETATIYQRAYGLTAWQGGGQIGSKEKNSKLGYAKINFVGGTPAQIFINM